MKSLLDQFADLNFLQTLMTIFFTTWLTFILSNWRTGKLQQQLMDEIRMNRNETKTSSQAIEMLILNSQQLSLAAKNNSNK
jgi:hypothetical protein